MANKPDEIGTPLTSQAAMAGHIGILYVGAVDDTPAQGAGAGDAILPEVRDCLSLCQKLVIERGGSIVKAADDGAMCSFADADSALLAAREMQLRVQQSQAGAGRVIAVRIGLHFGVPITAGAAAQRVALLAGGRQIFATAETLEWLSAPHRAATRQRELPSRNKRQNITVYEVMWQPDGTLGGLPEGPVAVAKGGGASRLRLVHLGRETLVDNRITIGRRAGHDIVLDDPVASRDHAYIERRKDKFVLVDHSKHGTYISLDTGEERRVQRDEVVLHDSGVLSFAHPAGHKGTEIISFWCEPDNVVLRKPARR
jgi:adenylate cyclase